ncbi:MAG: 4-alpha-glucanotransferase [Actinomycetia bacterium]|nr:4-alpha-glucanotransferase [Actinomycetes bacterium]
MSDLDPDLRALAEELGVATEFWDWQGRHVRVARETVLAVLAGLGLDAGTPERAAAALREHRLARWRQMLPPIVVTRAGWTPWVWVHLPHGAEPDVWVELEDGGRRHDLAQQDRWVAPVDVDGTVTGEATYELPSSLPVGWHTLHARCEGRHASSPLVVTPPYLGLGPRCEGQRTWGFMAQLYQLRSARSWGLGDLADLADLASWSGHDLGAGFLLANPLHAASPVPPMTDSPYLPVTRRFANPLYLRVEAVPEYAYLSAADRARVDALAAPLHRASRSAALLDRDAAWAAKLAALEIVRAVPLTPGRQAAFDAFREREGSGLVDFATWNALVERHGWPWTAWPEELWDPGGPAVAAARAELADRVALHSWLQWLLDEQLATAQRSAREAGMPVGVVHDLAVGVHPEGADSWALQDVLARGITVGAPPDAFNQQGQDWSQPPWHPGRLADAGYAPYRDMLRTVLRHAGGLRVDHVLGLFRLWWVPAGLPPSAGTYVRYDHEALVGILALEAWRAGAFVVGEDLGTVEPWVRDYLRERGLAGTSILWFERGWQHEPLRPEHWRELCLATVTTHDLPPTAGYLDGEHIRIRGDLGLLTRSVEEERAIDAGDRDSWLDLLRELGLLRHGADVRETVEALHRFLGRTPARLLGVALPDAVGDTRAQNQPGTDREYPNWRVPLCDGSGEPVLLEDLAASERVRSLARAVGGA